LRVKDPIIELGKDNTASPIVDLGLILTRPTGNSNVAIIFDESTDTLEIGYTQGNASDTDITMQTAAANPISVNVNGTISGNGSGLTALPAVEITGTLDVARIPSLAASKITSGTLGVARIPSLAATKITTGTLDVARIPTLNQNTTGSAATLTTPRSIGGVNFDGSAAIVPTTFGVATFSGDVTVDSTTFHVDSTDNRVGIGTTSPISSLQVKVPSSSSLVWGTTITNPYNGATATQGIGLKLQMDGSATWYGDDKWCGIAAKAEGNYSDELGLAFYTQGTIGSDPGNAPTEKMRIDADGNVGIGTTSPVSTLTVGDGVNPTSGDAVGSITLTGTGATKSAPGNPGIYHRAGVGLGLWSDAHMSMEVDGTNGILEAMRIKNNGNVGIGTTDPETRLHVNHDLHLQASSENWNATVGKGLYLRYSLSASQDGAYIQSIDRGNTSLKYPINFDASSYTFNTGIVTNPNKPAFYAWDNSTSRSGTTLTFDSTTYNTGSHYNTSTSRFQTPVAGTYIFAAVIAHDVANTLADVYYSFYVDGVFNRDILEGTDAHDAHHEQHAVYIVQLNAGQYVDIRARSNTNITFINGNHGAYYRNCFQGALIG
jgi:hypothetical protein